MMNIFTKMNTNIRMLLYKFNIKLYFNSNIPHKLSITETMNLAACKAYFSELFCM